MSISYNNIQSFLTDTLKIPDSIVTKFLDYNKIVFKRYVTNINKQQVSLNVKVNDTTTNTNTTSTVNMVSLMVNNISHTVNDVTYLSHSVNNSKHVFFYPIFKNQTSQSYNISYTDDFTNLMQFSNLLDIASMIGSSSSVQGVNNIVKFLEDLFFKLNLPKLSQGIEDGSESFTVTIPLIYFNVKKNDKQPYLTDLSILYSYMTSSSSTIKIGGSELNILKPLNTYAYVELGNGFSYGLCGVESLSYSVENIRLQYDLPDNINISNVYTNIVYVNVNVTFQRIFPNVPIRYDNNIISLNYEVRNNKPISTRNYFVVSI